MNFTATKAVKRDAKLRLAIEGPGGCGKSWTLLTIAKALGERTVAVDTEHEALEKYAPHFNFDIVRGLTTYSYESIPDLIDWAHSQGYGTLQIDNFSHYWMGPGGALEQVNTLQKTSGSKDKMAGWLKFAPIERKAIDAILRSPIHILCALRTKNEWEDQVVDGQKKRVKVGTTAVQRDSLEYEFDVVARMDLENTLVVEKTRCPDLNGKVFTRPGVKDFAPLVSWLKGDAPALETPPAAAALGDLDAIRAFAKERYGIKNAAQLDAWLSTEGLTRDAAFERWRGEMGVAQ